jgi:CRISPR-associated protein Csd1
MILQALDAYYQRKQATAKADSRLPEEGFEFKEIPFVLEIEANGTLVGISDTRTLVGKKSVAQRFLVPQGVKKTSGISANLLWDAAEYVLGIDTRGNAERVEEQHLAFRKRVQSLPDAVKGDPGVAAVLMFMDSFRPEHLDAFPGGRELLGGNPVVSFRLRSDVSLVCQRQAVTDLLSNGAGDSATGVCLVRGGPSEIQRLHPAIKGVWGAQTSGANIVSFNLESFKSYGKEQGANAPVGKAAVFAYTTALNHLLARESRQRIQVGDASTVFWAEEEHDLESSIPDLFGDPPKDDPDRNVRAVEALYASVQSGRFAFGGLTTRFHVLGLAPNAARIAIRFWETATAAELAARIKQYFDDIDIVHADFEPGRLSLFRLLSGVALQNKIDNVPPNLGGEVIRAVLQGLPYPVQLLNLAVGRSRAEQKVTYARAAAIKACLNRSIRSRNTQEKEFLPMLDPSNVNAAYRLGRLFAALEKIQEEASPGLNATIRDRYYGAASSTPVSVFTTLLRLKNHHIAKLTPGRAVQMERLVGEILGGLDDFPRHLPLPDQGRFALGYYHQRQAFFTRSEPKNEGES